MAKHETGQNVLRGIVLVGAIALTLPRVCSAQVAGCGVARIQSVGGVSINTDGELAEPDVKGTKEMREDYLKALKTAEAELNRHVEIRKISLRALENAVAKSGKSAAFQLP